VDGCPQQIPIPDIFAAANREKTEGIIADFSKLSGGKASDCIRCGQCQESCPQFLPICSLLRKLAEKSAD